MIVSQTKTVGALSYSAALRSLRPVLAAALVFSALVNVLMLTGSVYMLQVYDRVLTSGSVPTLVGLFAIVVVLYAFMGLYDLMRIRVLSRASLRLDRDLGARAFGQSLTDRQLLGDLDLMRNSLSSPAVIALCDLPFVPLFLGLLFVLHPWLGWLTVAGAGFACLIALTTHTVTRRAMTRAQASELLSSTLEAGSRRAADTVLALGLVGPLGVQWRRYRDTQLAALQAGRDPADALAAFSRAFRMLLQSAILSLGAYLVIVGDLSGGMIIASSILSGRALTPIDQIAGHASTLARTLAAHRRLVIALPVATAGPAIVLPRPKGQLDVAGLTQVMPASNGAAPRPDLPHILSDVGFSLVPGDILGVIGPSGSGKSTLARLLVGASVADGGTVRLDGATLDQWTDAQRTGFLGYLPQRVDMLPGTIRDNIARFDPAAPDADVIAAAQLAGVHEVILRLPGGYGTWIGDVVLSGGQMQRIALARAVYGNPALVVLDEPNAHLDRLGEMALVAAIDALSQAGTTVIIIAHRTEALRSLTKLLILKDGRVNAFGLLKDVLATQQTHPNPGSVAEAHDLLRPPFTDRASRTPISALMSQAQKVSPRTASGAALRPIRQPAPPSAAPEASSLSVGNPATGSARLRS